MVMPLQLVVTLSDSYGCGASGRAKAMMRRLVWITISQIWLSVACLAVPAAQSNDAGDCASGHVAIADEIAACTRLIVGAPNDAALPDIYRERGAAYLQNDDIDSAIRDFNEAINRRPDFANAYQNRGVAKFKRGDYESALADLNLAIKFNGDSAVFYGFRGVILNAMGEYDLAIADFGKSIRIDKSYANAFNNRGYAYQRKRMSKEALQDYTEAINLSPKTPKFYIGRASVKMDMDQLDGAITDLNEAIRLDPRDSEAFLVRAEANRLRHDLGAALSDCEAAIRLSPNADSAYVNRGLVLRDKRDYDGMIASLNQAIVINPKNDLAFANRGEGERLKGDLDQSLKDLDRAVELSPRSPLPYTLRGDTLRAKGEYDKAIADYDSANHFVSDFVAAFVGRGLALQAKGDREGAKAEFEKALKLPSDSDKGRAVPAQAIARERLAAIAQQDRENQERQQQARQEQAKQEQQARQEQAKQEQAKQEQARQEQARQQKEHAKQVIAEAKLPDQGVRVALVIGMSKYQSVPPLDNPENDAKEVAQTLKEIGFNSVKLVLDATRSQLTKALRGFQELADKADWAVVFYAGHGIEINGQNYLIPVDAQLATDRDADDEAVPLAKIMDRIHKARKLQVVILDACRNNPFQVTMRRSDGTRGIDHARGLARVEPDSPNELIVYAAKDGEVAADGHSNHSPFSASLIARLKERGVEVTQTFRDVTRDVYDATNKTQRPFVYGSSLENFYFNVK
jgi:tetratricopeptide (TPR) repeat protein